LPGESLPADFCLLCNKIMLENPHTFLMKTGSKKGSAIDTAFIFSYTKNQLKTIQKIEHNLAYMDYAMIFCL